MTNTCGDCERYPHTKSRRCYYDTIRRNSVHKQSGICDNFKSKFGSE